MRLVKSDVGLAVVRSGRDSGRPFRFFRGVGALLPSVRAPELRRIRLALRSAMPDHEWWNCIGLFLLAAAVMKADPRLVAASGDFSSLRSPLAVVASIWLEVALGCWALVALHSRVAKGVLAACFTVFAAFALTSVVSNATSCGCFGMLRIPPWIMLAADAVTVAALLLSRVPKSTSSVLTHPRRATFAGAVAILLAVTLSVNFVRRLPQKLDVSSLGRLVVLEPRDWVDHVFPLTGYIGWDVAEPTLMEGDWLVVLHRRSCPACQDLLGRIKRIGANRSSQSIALVEIVDSHNANPESTQSNPDLKGVTSGRMNLRANWFIETPAMFEISGGIVRGIPSVPAASSRF
jgi:hypothetical protein